MQFRVFNHFEEVFSPFLTFIASFENVAVIFIILLLLMCFLEEKDAFNIFLFVGAT